MMHGLYLHCFKVVIPDMVVKGLIGFKIRLYDTNWAQILGQSSPCPTPFAFKPPLVVLEVLSLRGIERSGHYPVFTALGRSPVALCQRHSM